MKVSKLPLAASRAVINSKAPMKHTTLLLALAAAFTFASCKKAEEAPKAEEPKAAEKAPETK